MKLQFKKWISIVFPSVCFLALFWILFKNSSDLNWSQILSSPKNIAKLLAAIALCTLNSIAGFLMWFWLLNRTERRIELGAAYSLFTVSALAKYLPGGAFLQLASFVHFSESPRLKSESIIAMLLSMAVGMQAGGLVAIMGAANFFQNTPFWVLAALTAALLCTFFLLSRIGILQPLLSRLNKKFASVELPKSVPLLVILQTTAVCIAAWLCLGLAGLELLSVVRPEVGWSAFWIFIESYYFSCWAGYIAVFSPAGLGVIEGSIVALMARTYPLADTAFLALNFRLCLVAADFIFAFPLLARWLWNRRLSIGTSRNE